MRKTVRALVVLVAALTLAASSAAAAPISVIGIFSWDDSGLGIGPTFTFENLLGDPLENLSVELDTDGGPLSFGFTSPLGNDTDGDGVEDAFVASPIIPSGASVQIPDDLSGLVILHAFIRAQNAVLFLLDLNGEPLLEAGAPSGLDGPFMSALVGVEITEPPPPPPPTGVPEPATVLLLGFACSALIVRSRRVHQLRR